MQPASFNFYQWKKVKKKSHSNSQSPKLGLFLINLVANSKLYLLMYDCMMRYSLKQTLTMNHYQRNSYLWPINFGWLILTLLFPCFIIYWLFLNIFHRGLRFLVNFKHLNTTTTYLNIMVCSTNPVELAS